MKLEKNEAIAIIVSIAVIAVMFVGVRLYPFGSGTNSTGNDAANAVSLPDLSDKAAVSSAFADAMTEKGKVTKLITQDTVVGNGAEVVQGSKVTVNYIGTLEDGTVFDNSFERGEPFTFTVGDGSVIKGWEQGVLGMKEGGQRILVIPASLGYGSRSVGPIPPNATLLFAIEVVSVE